MRVSTTYLHTQGVQNILDQQAKLVAEQNKISKGVNFTSPSDDPGAFARIMSLDEVISQMTQHEENANYATQRLNLEESTLDSVSNLLIRVKELSIQAANIGTYGGEEERIIAAEIREKLQELLGYANTRDASGEFIFAGFQSAIEPFVSDGNGNYLYNGDQGNLAIQIGTNRQVIANDSGAEVFQMIRTGNGTFAVDANSTNGGVAKISTGSVITSSLVQAHDFSIVFSENQPTAGSYAIDVSALASFDFTTDQVSFDVDTTTVTLASNVNDPAGMAAAIATALGTTNYAVSENAGTITIARTATGATSTAPVISNFDGDVDLGGAVIADFISGGLSVTGTDAPANPPQFEYSVINNTTGVTVLANQAYSDGGIIAFNGIQVEISGEPADGDVFTVEASRHQDMFNTLNQLINSLEAPISADVRGVIGGDFVNNGFDVGDVIDFNMQFNDQFIPINFTVGAASNAAIAGQIFTEITAVAGVTNPDGSVTIAGSAPGTDITFRLNATGTEIEFISSGGTRNNQNTFSISNLRDSVANDAVLSLTASGNTIASSSAASTPATATNIAALRVDISAGLDLSAVAAADRTFSLEVNGVTQNVVIPAVDYTAAPVGVGDGTSAALLAAINTAINSAFGSPVAIATESAVGGLALSTTATGPGTTITVAEAAGVGAANLFGAVIPQITVGNGAVSFLSGTPHRSYLSQQIDNALNNLSRAFDSVTKIQTSIGGRLNAIDSQLETNAAKKEHMQKIRSDIEDLDLAEAISNMTFQTSVLQIAQQTFVKIQNLSLFNFI